MTNIDYKSKNNGVNQSDFLGRELQVIQFLTTMDNRGIKAAVTMTIQKEGSVFIDVVSSDIHFKLQLDAQLDKFRADLF